MNFPIFLLLRISNWIPLWSKNTFRWPSPFGAYPLAARAPPGSPAPAGRSSLRPRTLCTCAPAGRSSCARGECARAFLAGGEERVLEPRAVGSFSGRRVPKPPWYPNSGTFQIKKECLACRGAAAVFDMSYFGKFFLVGPDARKAADWLFSADVSRPPGMEREGCVPPPPQCGPGHRLTAPGSRSSRLCPQPSPGPPPPAPSALVAKPQGPAPSTFLCVLHYPPLTLFQRGFEAAGPQNSLLGLRSLSIPPLGMLSPIGFLEFSENTGCSLAFEFGMKDE